MQTIERVYNILSRCDFLVYRGGAGGEFLSYLIYKYSNSYRNNEIKDSLLSFHDVNKTIIEYPQFFKKLAELPQQEKNILYTLPLLQEDCISEAEYFLERHKKFIIRMHYVNSPILINRSIYILLDNKNCFDYAGLLLACKNQILIEQISMMSTEHEKKYSLVIDNKDDTIRKIINYMESNNLKTISALALSIIFLSKLDINEILESNINDLYFKYGHINFSNFEHYYSIFSPKPFKKIINFSDIFVKGILEDIFDIDDDMFRVELLNWHENNLALLGNNGVDHSQFKLT